MNVDLTVTQIEEWLEQQSMQSFTINPHDPLCGKVWYSEKQYHDLFNPFMLSQHPLDRKRVETLSDLWNKQSSTMYFLCYYFTREF